jgi:16S rRNA (cytosine967-C5)-methyltransferase
LIYATCSFLGEENEAQIERFLAAHKAFRLVPCSDVLENICKREDSISNDLSFAGAYLLLTPVQHKTDGFFGAILELEY